MRPVLLLSLVLMACGGGKTAEPVSTPSSPPPAATGFTPGGLESEIVAITARRVVAEGVNELDFLCPHGLVIPATIPDWQAQEYNSFAVLTFQVATKDGETIPHWRNLNLEPVSLD